MRFTYTALRALAPGHDSDQEYLAIVVGQAIDTTLETARSENTTLSGLRDMNLRNQKDRWRVITDYLGGQARLEFEEFLQSVAGGAPFIFDPYGDTASLFPVSAVLTSRRHSRRRLSPGGEVQFSYTLDIEEKL